MREQQANSQTEWVSTDTSHGIREAGKEYTYADKNIVAPPPPPGGGGGGGGEVCLRRTTKSVNDITHWAQFGSSASAVLGRLDFGVGPGKGGRVPY